LIATRKENIHTTIQAIDSNVVGITMLFKETLEMHLDIYNRNIENLKANITKHSIPNPATDAVASEEVRKLKLEIEENHEEIDKLSDAKKSFEFQAGEQDLVIGQLGIDLSNAQQSEETLKVKYDELLEKINLIEVKAAEDKEVFNELNIENEMLKKTIGGLEEDIQSMKEYEEMVSNLAQKLHVRNKN
jgi:chromosome segregation ATPase